MITALRTFPFIVQPAVVGRTASPVVSPYTTAAVWVSNVVIRHVFGR